MSSVTKISVFVANISSFRFILLQKLREQLAIYVMNLIRVNLKDPSLLQSFSFMCMVDHTV